jgi:hypothetical protein
MTGLRIAVRVSVLIALFSAEDSGSEAPSLGANVVPSLQPFRCFFLHLNAR